MSRAAGPLPQDVRRHLATARLGRRIYFYPETTSTNDVALEFSRRGEAEGTLVVTDHQRRGRGRRGHAWSAPPGRDIMASVILRPEGSAHAALATSLVFACSIAVALSKLTGVEFGVAWPNDVVSASRKVAGILAESVTIARRVSALVVGFGINVNSVSDDFPPEIRAHAASCRTLTDTEWDRALVLADALGTIEAYHDRYARDGFAPLVGAYEARLVHMGRRVAFDQNDARHTGRVLGVAEDGALRVARDAGGAEARLYGESVEVIE